MKRTNVVLIILVLITLITTISYANNGFTYIKDGKIVYEPVFTDGDDFKEIRPLGNGYNQYIDYPYGYSINYPSHMNVDVSLSKVKTLIFDNDTYIEIYYDNFQNTPHTSQGYINYSNKFLSNTSDHILQRRETLKINGLKTNLLVWTRKKLSRVPDDKNYYVSAEIVKNSREVYTIFIKSSKPIENYMYIINSFKTIEKRGIAKINTTFNNINLKYHFNNETKDFYEKYFINSEELRWGIFENTAPKSMDFLNNLEKQVGYEFKVLVRYQHLNENYDITDELMNAYNQGKYVELTLQTIPDNERRLSVIYDILDGKYDEFLNNYAKMVRNFGHPVIFRLNNEMNGDWCVYSSYYHSKDTDLYKKMWIYVHDIFRRNGVNNAVWVWNPHDLSFPGFKWNHYLNYYPGDNYVDIIGLTGYNTGTYYVGEKWRNFNEIYDELYEEYTSIFNYPMMITEFGANSVGGNKIEWIKDMFVNIRKYDNIKVAIWFNGIDFDQDGKPARIYRLDESEEMLKTFNEGFKEY